MSPARSYPLYAKWVRVYYAELLSILQFYIRDPECLESAEILDKTHEVIHRCILKHKMYPRFHSEGVVFLRGILVGYLTARGHKFPKKYHHPTLKHVHPLFLMFMDKGTTLNYVDTK